MSGSMYVDLAQEISKKKSSKVKKYSVTGSLIATILICMFLISKNIIDGYQPVNTVTERIRNSDSTTAPTFDSTFVLEKYTVTPELGISKQLECYRLNNMRCSPSEIRLYGFGTSILCQKLVRRAKYEMYM